MNKKYLSHILNMMFVLDELIAGELTVECLKKQGFTYYHHSNNFRNYFLKNYNYDVE
ncbi:MAG: hypothetical protein LUH05_04900 [Candidatus Gastranaerophilales bacterium]|nr:hypothetical protein [Candidatus Gastranaerophilales bacterium]